MIKELFAFWCCGFFPYIIGGKVTKIYNKGLVDIEDRPFSYESFRITELEEGLELQAKLDQLDEEYYAKKLALDNEYILKVKELGFTELEVPYLMKGIPASDLYVRY